MTYPTQPTASHFINGQYVEDTAGTPIDVIYPATGEKIATVYSATPAIIAQALDAAKSAQAAWAGMSGTERGRILRRAADIMRERNHDLSVLETFDTGKPYQETIAVDGQTTAVVCCPICACNANASTTACYGLPEVPSSASWLGIIPIDA